MHHSKSFKSIQQRLRFFSSLIANPKFYTIINEVLTNPSKLDLTLGTLCYSTLFISAALKKFPQWKLFARKILLEIVLMFNKIVSFVFRNPKSKYINKIKIKIDADNDITDKEKINTQGKISQSLEQMSTLLNDFSNYITDIRIFNRGFSIPGSIADLIESKQLLKDSDYLNFISTWCITLYQPLETTAFLFDHNWLLPSRENNPNWWYAISTRFWFVWVVAELSQLSYRLIVKQKCKNVDKDEIIELIEHIATIPLCIHWSLEDGWLDSFNVGLFGTIAGGLSTVDLWKNIWRNILKEC